jgi:hypothetical protein
VTFRISIKSEGCCVAQVDGDGVRLERVDEDLSGLSHPGILVEIPCLINGFQRRKRFPTTALVLSHKADARAARPA